jgi:hypothetical protein
MKRREEESDESAEPMDMHGMTDVGASVKPAVTPLSTYYI